MSTTTTTEKKENAVGLTVDAYKGLKSTLCKGCGHGMMVNHFIRAYHEMNIPPHKIAKLSGIGCSSKSTNYFLEQSHGFNGVHGRMAAMAIGVGMANHKLQLLGVSGDGDTASIGLSHFCHMIRRNLDMVYVIENNGVFGLTKGQTSATADRNSLQKNGHENRYDGIDCCSMAIQMGCGFVGRGFAGDPKQVNTLLKAAIEYEGTAIIDILSPCVTFNNHEGSTKSISYARSHAAPLHGIGFVPSKDEIQVDYEPGEARIVRMHSGAMLKLKKLERSYHASDYGRAMELMNRAREEGLFYTGLLYYQEEKQPMADTLHLCSTPLAHLKEEEARPSRETFQEILDHLK